MTNIIINKYRVWSAIDPTKSMTINTELIAHAILIGASVMNTHQQYINAELMKDETKVNVAIIDDFHLHTPSSPLTHTITISASEALIDEILKFILLKSDFIGDFTVTKNIS